MYIVGRPTCSNFSPFEEVKVHVPVSNSAVFSQKSAPWRIFEDLGWLGLKERYSIGNVGQTASMSMLTLFESRYTLKGRYNIGNVGQTASMSMLTLFESRYTLKERYNICNAGQTASMSMLTLFELYIEGKVQHW